MTDGVIIDCSKFYPNSSPPSGGWPAIIFCPGFGLTKEILVSDAVDQVQFGYYCVVYTMRGQGFSTGKSNLISTTEMNDFNAVVNYVKSDPLVKATRVGANGGSQGGIIPTMAVCYGTSLRMIAPEVMSPDFASSWIENKSIKMTLLWTLSYDTSIARYTDQVRAYRAWILADTPDKWDSLAYYLPINRDFSGRLSYNVVPFHLANVWQDKFFNTYGWLKQLSSINCTYKMYLGTLDAHGGEYDSTEDNFYNFTLGEFYDYWLQDIPNHIMDSSKYVYAASCFPRSNNKWCWGKHFSNTWPPSGVQDINFYLDPYGRMRTVYNYSQRDTISFFNNIKDTTLTMTEAVNREFTGSVFDIKFGKTQLTFETPPLIQDTKLVGTPFVNLYYKSTANKAQFNFQIWDVQQDNQTYIVTRANSTERNITPNTIRQHYFYGTSSAHVFKAGHKIRVILTNLDNIANDPFLRTNPYVLPSLKRANNLLYMSPAYLTYVRLPLIGYIPNGITQLNENIPENYALHQNFPNPFNPVTKIKFDIPNNTVIARSSPGQTTWQSVSVSLKVFDIQGKEIITLVNDTLQPGNYEVTFNGNNLPSGTYFYQLRAGEFSETKKMILTK
jgi:predicted acyl esterase